jgi:hypothetical protein
MAAIARIPGRCPRVSDRFFINFYPFYKVAENSACTMQTSAA